ncbi:3-oxoacyl-[acyl-carrier-protein] synthase 3 [bioreactor metagenome]|uniref:3-oxoacyl-[acyl-carrier-protein] synthase 3 n=1 Tax=bioreactor metagenome TaxID=1076179 RepID=A0A644YSJ3_9ZZZZ|nr:beta-ketoacyl-ACP synthase III [Oscillospiraceae bacterium]
MNFKIIATGKFIPERIVTNDELTQYIDTSDEWIKKRVGVHERHICTTQSAADLAYGAAINALENGSVKPAELDGIICACISSEYASPSIACILAQRLGLSCMAYDVSAACSGFIYLLETAAGFFARGKVKKLLIVGAERMSRMVDWRDRSTCVIFGDGAGAVLLEEGDSYKSSVFKTTGGCDVVCVPQFSGENSPFYKADSPEPFIHMNGQETFIFAVNSVCSDIEYLLAENNLSMEDIAYIVPHQANKRIIDYAAVRLKVSSEKFYLNIEKYGNTSSASIPIALDEMNRNGMLKRGDLIIMSAFGSGMTSAACLIKW